LTLENIFMRTMKKAYSRNKELPLFFGEVQMTGEKQNIDVSICILTNV
jgi:hypothetical protein